jgi:hypothetical protein
VYHTQWLFKVFVPLTVAGQHGLFTRFPFEQHKYKPSPVMVNENLAPMDFFAILQV